MTAYSLLQKKNSLTSPIITTVNWCRCRVRKDNFSSSSSNDRAWRQLTLRSPRRRCMGTAEAGLSHSGRCCHGGRRRRLVRTCRVPLIVEAASRDSAATARAAADWHVKRPVTRRRVTCTQRIQLVHKATKPAAHEMNAGGSLLNDHGIDLPSPGRHARALLDPYSAIMRPSFIRNRYTITMSVWCAMHACCMPSCTN